MKVDRCVPQFVSLLSLRHLSRLLQPARGIQTCTEANRNWRKVTVRLACVTQVCSVFHPLAIYLSEQHAWGVISSYCPWHARTWLLPTNYITSSSLKVFLSLIKNKPDFNIELHFNKSSQQESQQRCFYSELVERILVLAVAQISDQSAEGINGHSWRINSPQEASFEIQATQKGPDKVNPKEKSMKERGHQGSCWRTYLHKCRSPGHLTY